MLLLMVPGKDRAVPEGQEPQCAEHPMDLRTCSLKQLTFTSDFRLALNCRAPQLSIMVELALLFSPVQPINAQETVYGKRDGYISGLAVTSKEKSCIFKATRGMRQGIVHGVNMLQRASMFKPEVGTLKSTWDRY